MAVSKDAVLGTDFGKQVCDIFGLNPLIVRRMTLRIEPRDPVTLDVEIVVKATHASMLSDLMTKYELHEKAPEVKVVTREGVLSADDVEQMRREAQAP